MRTGRVELRVERRVHDDGPRAVERRPADGLDGRVHERAQVHGRCEVVPRASCGFGARIERAGSVHVIHLTRVGFK